MRKLFSILLMFFIISSVYADKIYRIENMMKSKCKDRALTLLLKERHKKQLNYILVSIPFVSDTKSTFFMIGDEVKVSKKFLYHSGIKYKLIITCK